MKAERRLRVLVTRPAEDATATADLLRAEGYEPAIEPMLSIEHDAATLALDGVQAILLTSVNGARALARATTRRDLPVFAVGDATAKAARAAGFGQVASADGDAGALAALVAARLRPAAGALLHVSGRDVAGDLAGTLSAAGFAVRRAALYRAEAAGGLSQPCRNMIAAGELDAILFFSPRSARSFVTLVAQAGLVGACRRIAAICLSKAVAEAAAEVAWREVRIAGRPTQAALFAALASWAGEGRGGDRDSKREKQ